MELQEFMESKIPVVEIFSSISGEGISAGEVVTFVRVAGCNLRCAYCDTRYSYDETGTDIEMLTAKEIEEKLSVMGTYKIIYTGGEPLESEKAKRYLPLYLAGKGYDIRIESNGSWLVYSDEEIASFKLKQPLPIHYVLDVKCPGSGMSTGNILEKNFEKLSIGDEIKFVVSDNEDIRYALDIIDSHKEILARRKITVNFSPVFDAIETKEIVKILVENNPYFIKHGLLVRLSLQIHKIIWSPQTRGV